MRMPDVNTNSDTLSDTVLRHSANTESFEMSATAAPSRLSVRPTAAYQASPLIVTSMTPARSPNMNRGCPPLIIVRQRLALQLGRFWRCRQHGERPVGDRQDVPVAHRAMLASPFEQFLMHAGQRVAVGIGEHQRVDELAGGKAKHRLGIAFDVFVPGHQRHEPRGCDDHQEDDDEGRDGTAQDGLRGKQPPVCRFGDDAGIARKAAFARDLVLGKSTSPGRVPRVRLCHNPAPQPWFSVDDPETPHIQIFSKESNVIRVVYRLAQKNIRQGDFCCAGHASGVRLRDCIPQTQRRR